MGSFILLGTLSHLWYVQGSVFVQLLLVYSSYDFWVWQLLVIFSLYFLSILTKYQVIRFHIKPIFWHNLWQNWKEMTFCRQLNDRGCFILGHIKMWFWVVIFIYFVITNNEMSSWNSYSTCSRVLYKMLACL